MKFYKLLTVFSLFLLLQTQNLFSQKNEEYLVIYDSIIGKENLPITNGLFHYNGYQINNNKNIYYKNDFFTKGSIEYLKQSYSNLKLKYDVLNDEIIFKPLGISENSGIIIQKEDVLSFKIHNKNFINLKKNIYSEKNGFYEVDFSNSEYSFLIKHIKSKKEIFIANKIKFEFNDYEKYFILKNEELLKINSKSSIIKIFPEKKKFIKSYFKDNKEIKKTNKYFFYSNLFSQI